MLSSPNKHVTREVARQLQQACGDGRDFLRLDRFIQTALYDPVIGYYTTSRNRVGRDRSSDFYTASSMRGTFARLVMDSIRKLLSDDCSDYAFVEIGPESESGIAGELDAHPFKSLITVHPGCKIHIPGKSVVFSNELFDAQPFRRFIYKSGKWVEAGVRVQGRELSWVLLPTPEDLPPLPDFCRDDYIVDWPQGCHHLLQEITRQEWSGLFMAFDYGLDSATVFSERPQGTGRTYSRHKMGTDLLDRPGEIDITHHVIWDHMEEMLAAGGFSNVRLLRQESFFMQFAQAEIQHIMDAAPLGFDRTKQSLMELIHPANMGHKFQVLSGRRIQN